MNSSPNFQDMAETTPTAENSTRTEATPQSPPATKPDADVTHRAEKSMHTATQRLQQTWAAPAVSVSLGATLLLTLFALVAIGISSYLAYASLTAGKIAGCDGGWFDCESVLKSKWSHWMNVPVSVLAIANYVGLLVALVVGNRAQTPRIRYYAWFAVTALGFSAGVAALWFIGLQTFVLKHFCPWCLGAHTCGLLATATLLWARPVSGKGMATAFGLAILGVSMLGFGQSLNPEPESFEVIQYDMVDEAAEDVETSDDGELFTSPDGLLTSPDETGGDGPSGDDADEDPFLFEAPSDESDDINESNRGTTENDEQGDSLSNHQPDMSREHEVAAALPPLFGAAVSLGDRTAIWTLQGLTLLSQVTATTGSRTTPPAATSIYPQEKENATTENTEQADSKKGDREDEAQEGETDPSTDDQPEQKKRRLAAISGGKIKLDIQQWPLIGNPDAEFVFVELFDYCCPHCRNTHKTIKQAMQQMDGQLAIVVLPVPLNTKCNSAVSRTGGKFVESCELARLAVAVWRADPEKFNQFHDWMFQGYDAPSFARALQYARELVGQEKLDESLNNRIVDSYVKKHVEIYRRLGAGTIPKLLFPRTGIVGEYSSVQGLVDFIRREGKILEETP